MRLSCRLLVACLSCGAVTPGMAQSTQSVQSTPSKFNFQQPGTSVAEQIYDLHTLMLLICGVIFVVVFGVMFWSILKHRKSRGAVAANFHENTTVEIIWTIVPVFILVGMAWPATKTILDMKDTSEPELTIKATGYQWK